MAKAKKRAAPRAKVSVQRTPARAGGGAVVVVREGAQRAARAVRRHRVSGAGGTAIQGRMQSMAMGGFGVGMVEKHFGNQLPVLPLIGRKGAIALAVYMFKPKNRILLDIGIAAACLSGYQFAKEGRVDGVGEVTGDEDDDY